MANTDAEQLSDWTHKHASEDIIVWADNTWCFRYELHEFNHMSDDYRVIPPDTQEWINQAYS